MKKFLSFLFTVILSVISSVSFATPFEANGIYYEKTSSTTVSVVAASYVSGWYTYYKGNVVVPETVVYNGNEYIVTEIGNQAFRGQSKLTSVSIPSSVKKIDDKAFLGCVSLANVSIHDNSSLEYIGREAFSSCKRLSSIYIPSNVMTIGEEAFKDCIALKEVNLNNVDIIERKAFQNCYSLIDINVDATEIGDLAFWECKNLRSVNMGSNVDKIGNGSFLQCSSLSDVNIGNNVREIGYEAFRWCLNLKKIVIPNSVESMDYGVFKYCTGLKEVTLSENLETIPAWALEQTAIEKIVIPATVKMIKSYAFIECRNLKEVVWAEGLETICQEAFSMTALENVSIPSTVMEIGVSVFSQCKNIKYVNIPENVIKISDNAFAKCPILKDAYVYGTVPPVIPYTTGIFHQCAAPVNVHVLPGYKNIYETSIGWAYNVDNHQTVIKDDIKNNATGIRKTHVGNNGSSIKYKVTGRVYIIKEDGKTKKVII